MKNQTIKRIWISTALFALALIFIWVNLSTLLAWAIVAAPNKGMEPGEVKKTSASRLAEFGIHKEIFVEVGPPDATLSLWILDPSSPLDEGRTNIVPTLLVLHGIHDNKESMMGLGKFFAAAGYRTVLADLRGQGNSSGEWLTFGWREARDLSQVIDRLVDEGSSSDRIGVMGVSYGGATAIQLAGIDARVKAVVAVAPFTDMSKVVPQYVKRYLPEWMIPDRCIDTALEKSGHLAGFDTRDASPLKAVRRTRAQVLLIHGREDRKIPFSHSRSLYEACRDHGQVILVDGAGHDSIMNLGADIIFRQSREWFDRWLQTERR